MTAYNAINGVPAMVHPDILSELKGRFGMDGFVVCDGAAFTLLMTQHKYRATYAELAAATLKAGVDCITDDPRLITKSLSEALEQGLIREEDLDRAITNSLRVRFRLGQFDPDERNPFTAVPLTAVNCPPHRELALRAARESIVLLRNGGQEPLLPLKQEKIKTIAVLGPLANVFYKDWYTGDPLYRVTPLEALVETYGAENVLFADGDDLVTIKTMDAAFKDAPYLGVSGWEKGPEAGFYYRHGDWGFGNHTFKSAMNGKFVSSEKGWVGAIRSEVWGWDVEQRFDLKPSGAGNFRVTDVRGREWGLNDTGEIITPDTGVKLGAEFAIETRVDGLAEAAAAAKDSDAAIVFVGNHPLLAAKETIDRAEIGLAPRQEALIRAALKANPNTVVVIVGSYPFALGDISEKAKAILYMPHGGQEAGNAVRDALTGRYNPAGRLPMTWYRDIGDIGDIEQYDIERDERTYRYFKGQPLYPFGFGLSYSRFEYSALDLSVNRLSAGGEVELRFWVRNAGNIAGDEVPQCYIEPQGPRGHRPRLELKAFERARIEPGESREFSFRLRAEDFTYWSPARGDFELVSGVYRLSVRPNSADLRLSAELRVEGEAPFVRDLSRGVGIMGFDEYQGLDLAEDGQSQICARVREGEESAWLCFRQCGLPPGAYRFKALAEASPGQSAEVALYAGEDGRETLCDIKYMGDGRWQERELGFTLAQSADVLRIRLLGKARLTRFWVIRE
jgi:beta-glucosidase